MTYETDWKTRYYELEDTLEQMITAFQQVLAKQNSIPPSSIGVHIRRTPKFPVGERQFICCVADGANLEFSFEFSTGGQKVSEVPFHRFNSAEIPEELKEGASSCLIKVRSLNNQRRSVVTKEVKL